MEFCLKNYKNYLRLLKKIIFTHNCADIIILTYKFTTNNGKSRNRRNQLQLYH